MVGGCVLDAARCFGHENVFRCFVKSVECPWLRTYLFLENDHIRCRYVASFWVILIKRCVTQVQDWQILYTLFILLFVAVMQVEKTLNKKRQVCLASLYPSNNQPFFPSWSTLVLNEGNMVLVGGLASHVATLYVPCLRHNETWIFPTTSCVREVVPPSVPGTHLITESLHSFMLGAWKGGTQCCQHGFRTLRRIGEFFFCVIQKSIHWYLDVNLPCPNVATSYLHRYSQYYLLCLRSSAN
jgi:hypothetical protein